MLIFLLKTGYHTKYKNAAKYNPETKIKDLESIKPYLSNCDVLDVQKIAWSESTQNCGEWETSLALKL